MAVCIVCLSVFTSKNKTRLCCSKQCDQTYERIYKYIKKYGRIKEKANLPTESTSSNPSDIPSHTPDPVVGS